MNENDITANPPTPALTYRSLPSGAAPASGPSGLSDYAVSPLGMPVALLRDEVRVAFLARTSTEDQQDPRQSILRQLGNSKTAIPESWVIVAHYYDVESGRMELEQRGKELTTSGSTSRLPVTAASQICLMQPGTPTADSTS